jgi:SsrA-binding protein
MARKKDPRRTARKGTPEPDDRVVLATNRRARWLYVIEQTFEAGLVLRGSEVKSLRTTPPSLAEGYARLKGGELWLEGVHVHPLPQAGTFNHEPLRPRKCLLHRRELRRLAHLLETRGATVVPLQIYFKGPRVKVELGVGRGRRKADKREHERAKADRREMREARR